MRIESLDLLKFGPFTDAKLTFDSDGPAFYLVYGPNEAGKSSALRATTQLLYGIPQTSRDNFIHDHKAMRIGGTLSNGHSDPLSIVRRKGRIKTLLDAASGEAIDESILSALLGGMHETVFTHTFGLSHEELISGGQALLEGDGDLGQALFSAGAGLAQLRDIKLALLAEAAEIFKGTGTNPRINAKLATLKEINAKLKEAALNPAEWETRSKAFDTAERNLHELRLSRSEQTAERDRLDRIQTAQPLTRQRSETLAELETLKNTPRLPANFGEHRRAAEASKQRAETDRQRAETSIANLNSKLDTLAINQRALDLRESIADLQDDAAIARQGIKDREANLAPQLQQLEIHTENLNEDLSQNGGKRLSDNAKLTSAMKTGLTELSRRAEAVHAALDTASLRRNDLNKDREAARSQRDRAPAPVDFSVLRPALSAARRTLGDHERMLKKREEISQSRDHVETLFQRLGRTKGTVEDLATASFPEAAMIEDLRDRFDALDNERERTNQALIACENELAKTTEGIAALQKRGEVPSEKALSSARAKRDRGWRLVREAWTSGRLPKDCTEADATAFLKELGDPDLLHAYEHAVDAADRLADRLRREAEHVADLATLEAKADRLKKEHADAQAELETLHTKRDELHSTWTARWNESGITAGSPREMTEWSRKTAVIVSAWDSLRKAEAEADAAASTIETVEKELRSALAAAQAPTPDATTFPALVDRAESLLEDAEEAQRNRETIEQRLHDLELEIGSASESLQSAQHDTEAWNTSWAEALSPLGLNVETQPPEVDAILAKLEDLRATENDAAGLRARLEAIAAAEDRFRTRTQKLCTETETAFTPEREEDAARQLQQLVENSLAASKESEALRARITEDHERIQAATDEANEHSDVLQRCCNEAKVDAVEHLPEAEAQSARRAQLDEIQERLTRDLNNLAGETPLAEFIAQALSPPENLATRILELNATLEDMEPRENDLRDAVAQEKHWLRQADGSEEAARLAQDRADLIASIETDIEEYAALYLAERALHEAIERYRKANQGPLLDRAGEVFSQLTAGAFVGLATDYDSKDKLVIVALRRDTSTPIAVEDMSEGTADQLYLALRLASIEHYMDTHEPMPVILDDLLVNFDDNRANATLGVLGELASRTQVIFFTHHRHLVALAKAAIPPDRLHLLDLPAPS